MLKKSERLPFVQSRIDVTIPTSIKNVTIENPMIKPYSNKEPAEISLIIRLIRNLFIGRFLCTLSMKFINSFTNSEFIFIAKKKE
jgi:hypothetical protein